MQTIQNIKKVALIFFVMTGLLHLGSGIFIANNLFFKEALILNNVMDIPFIITGLIYGFASLRLSLSDPNRKHKILDISLIIIIMLVLVGLIVINLLYPDSKLA